MTINVRPVVEADKAAWSALWDEYLAFYHTSRSQAVKDVAWGRILDPDTKMFSLLAETDQGEVIGLANYLFHASLWDVEPVCYLNDLYVDPQARGSGTGRALIEAMTKAARQANVAEIYWLTAEDNATARRLYDSLAQKTPFIHYVMPET